MDKKEKVKKEERKGEIIQLSGTAYIKAGAIFGGRKAEVQKAIDEAVKMIEEKRKQKK